MPKASFLFYKAPEIERSDFDHYQTVHDPVLGWPTTEALQSALYDDSGSRPVPAFPVPGNECVTLYGDSFTYAEDVSDEEAWGNVLAQRLGCRIGNFGVAAYGTDQALLRFEQNSMDVAPVTILGIFPHDILRNVNQYPYLVTTSNGLLFKPRFIIRDGELRFVPKPQLGFSDLERLSADPGRVLTNETFLPGTRSGPQTLQFPYALVLLKVLLQDRTQNWWLGSPSWIDFLERDHPSQAHPVTVGIANRFLERCARRDKECFVLVFPTPSSYRYFVKTGRLSTKPLVDALEQQGVPTLVLDSYFAEKLGERSFCEIVTDAPDCVGHLSAEGNRLVAEFVHQYFLANATRFALPGGARPTDTGN